jgi:glycosyltransferase involved in cell wall biosynthesis
MTRLVRHQPKLLANGVTPLWIESNSSRWAISMRVSLVTETYAPQVNGVSRTLGELVRHLTERGDDVQVIHPNYHKPPSAGNVCLVRSVNLPFYREIYLPLPPFGRVHRAIDAFQPDLIHIATEATLGLSVLRYAQKREIPVVSSFHTNFDQYSRHYGIGWIKGIVWRYLRWFHNRTRETYVPSMNTIHQLGEKGFERLVRWPRGVHAEFFRPDRPGRDRIRRAYGWKPDDLVITYVSRIAPEKNVEHLAEAFEIVAAQRPDVKFLLVGDGPSRPELEQRLGTFARFAGYQTGEALADHYAAGDLFAFPSVTETFGNVVLEAMASGLPVVAIRAGGVGEIVQPGKTGLLIEPDQSPDCFARGLLDLVDDVDRLRVMGANARDYALSQSWDAIMSDLRDRYARIVGAQAMLVPEPATVA